MMWFGMDFRPPEGSFVANGEFEYAVFCAGFEQFVACVVAEGGEVVRCTRVGGENVDDVALL